MSKKFGIKSTAMEVIEGHDLTGYEIIVTGASSGIGVETVRAFAKAGARVVMGVRDVQKAEKVADDIRKTTGSSKVEIEKLELDNFASINEFVKRYLAKNRPLHILVNNAGVMATPEGKTKDGFETQFGTNHMGHFALTIGLLPALKQGHQQTKRISRVINVSSLGHVRTPVDFDDVNFVKRPYDKWVSYGQSKTANIWFSIALSKHHGQDGILSNAVMPGMIQTGLQQNLSLEDKKATGLVDEEGNLTSHAQSLLKTVEQGASTSVWASVAPELENVGGKYLEDCTISTLKASGLEVRKDHFGYVAHACDENGAEKLWQLSHEWLKNPPK